MTNDTNNYGSNQPASPPPSRQFWLRVPRQLYHSGVWGRLLVIVVTLATLLLVFYVEEKVRGAWALKQFIRQMEKQGLSLDVQQLLPPPIPPEKNLAQCDILRPLYDFAHAQTNQDTNVYALFEKRLSSAAAEAETRGYRNFPGRPGSWRQSVGPDPLKMLGEPKPAPVNSGPNPVPSPDQAFQMIQEIFQQSTGPLLDALQRETQTRTQCSFAIPYDTENPFALLLPHLPKFKMLGQLSANRALTALHFQQVEPAFKDIQLGFSLSDGLKSEPYLISLLVRIALNEQALYPVWQGLATHQWNTNQLRQFQQRFEAVDLLQEMRQSMKTELILGNRFIETFRRQFPRKMNFSNIGDSSEPGGNSLSGWNLEWFLHSCYPKGWLYFEQLNYLRYFTQWLLDPLGDKASWKDRRTRDLSISQGWEYQGANRIFKHTIIASMLLPALGKVTTRSALSQNAHDLAATACALERFHLDQGRYPEKLSELVPHYKSEVPRDIITGTPLIYHRNTDGTFTLYSIGQNGVDDGGTVAVGKSGALRNEEGDWVWKYPAQP